MRAVHAKTSTATNPDSLLKAKLHVKQEAAVKLTSLMPISSMLLFALSLILLGAGAAFADENGSGKLDNGLKYEIYSGLVTIVDYDEKRSEIALVIPETVEGCPVTTIGPRAFDGSSITSVSIPPSVTSIGARAFRDCGYLEQVSIPSSVTEMGDGAFYGCKRLTSVDIPGAVEKLDLNLFARCESLSSVTLNEGTASIDSSSFSGCPIKNVHLPASVTSLKDGNPFYGIALDSIDVAEGNDVYNSDGGCNAIIETATGTLVSGCRNTVIPDTVTAIGKRAFAGAPMPSITIPASVTALLYGAFEGSGLETVAIPPSITSFAKDDGREYGWTFGNCGKLVSVQLPSNFTKLSYSCFNGCTSLMGINIPEGVTVIDSWAFGNCSSLKSMTLPSGLESIEYCAFTNAGIRDIHFPDGLKHIAMQAFQNCNSLENLVIPGNLDTDSNSGDLDSSFHSCDALKTVEFAEGATRVGRAMFRMDPSLKTVILPSTIADIGREAFTECGDVAIYFKGDPPTCGGSIVDGGIGYYPADNSNWTEEAMAGIRAWGYGSITWVPWFQDGEPINSLVHAVITGYSSEVSYTGSPVTFPNLKVTLGGKVLVEGTDYTVAYRDNTGPGTGRVTVTGTGDYTGSKTVTFEIEDPLDHDSTAVGEVSANVANTPVTFFVGNAADGDTWTPMTIQWGSSLFAGASTNFDNRLAIAAAVLAGAPEHSQDLSHRVLSELGVNKLVVHKGYDKNDVNEPAMSIGYAQATIDGERKNLYAVTIRGTSNLEDVGTDVGSVSTAFQPAGDYARKQFDAFAQTVNLKYPESKAMGNMVFIVGHSLGGAVANRLAVSLSGSSSYPQGNLFCYAFATPNYVDSRSNGFRFIHNVVSDSDVVPNQGFSARYRWGSDVRWNPQSTGGFANAFATLTKGRSYQNLTEGNLLTTGKNRFERIINKHVIETYMAYLLSRSDAQELWRYKVGQIRKVSVRCPVDVELIDVDGGVAAKVVGNNVVKETPGIEVEVQGDEKFFYLLDGEEYEVNLVGNASGSMEFGIDDIELEGASIVSSKTFSGVGLEAGKQLKANVNPADSVSAEQLYVIDKAGTLVAEVATDGTEKAIAPTPEVKDSPEKAKAKNPMTAKAKKKSFKVSAKKLKKKAQKVSKPVTVKKAQGTVTFSNTSAKKALKKFKVAKKTGTVTVPKKTKKGTYKLAVAVSAAGNDGYSPASKKVTLKISVK